MNYKGNTMTNTGKSPVQTQVDIACGNARQINIQKTFYGWDHDHSSGDSVDTHLVGWWIDESMVCAYGGDGEYIPDPMTKAPILKNSDKFDKDLIEYSLNGLDSIDLGD